MAQLLWDTVHVTSPRKKCSSKWPFGLYISLSRTNTVQLKAGSWGETHTAVFLAPSLSNRVLAIAKPWKPLRGASVDKWEEIKTLFSLKGEEAHHDNMDESWGCYKKIKYGIVPFKWEIRAVKSREMMEGRLPEGESMRNLELFNEYNFILWEDKCSIDNNGDDYTRMSI